jgi:hypothetical protein
LLKFKFLQSAKAKIFKKKVKNFSRMQCRKNILGVNTCTNTFLKEVDMGFLEKRQEKHDFHFVIAQGMLEGLAGLRVFNKVMSFSGVVAEIISELAPVVKAEHKWGRQRRSRYLCVATDPGEDVRHVHAYLDEDVYRELKLIHQDLNFYSMAQILRLFLGLFLRLVDKYGDNVFRVLEWVFKQLEKFDNDNRLTLREKIRQLFMIIRFLQGERGHITLYNQHFEPSWIMRL